MKKIFFKIFFFSGVFFALPNFAWAAPTIQSANSVIQNAQSVSIVGTGFGSKSVAAPLKFADFESDTVGQLPNGWANIGTPPSPINNNFAHSGSNSIDSGFTNITNDLFLRDTYDTGATIPLGGTLYMSAWMYLDKTGSTAADFNWKGPMFNSSNTKASGGAPYWEVGSTPNSTTGFGGFHSDRRGWNNTATTIQYSQDGTAVNNSCTAGNSWASDSFIFGGWQRIEWIFQMNTLDGSGIPLADGTSTVNRIGRIAGSSLHATGCKFYGNTSGHWRYVSFPQGVTNICNYGTATIDSNQLVMDATPRFTITPGMTITSAHTGMIPDGTTVISFDGDRTITMSANATLGDMTYVYFDGVLPQLSLKMNFDDVYIDNSQARVEICDANSWASRTHCEIQPLISWSDAQVDVTINKGSFADGQTYLYVIDANGNVSPSYSVTFSSADITAPSAPSGLSVL